MVVLHQFSNCSSRRYRGVLFFSNLPSAAQPLVVNLKEKLLQFDPVGIALRPRQLSFASFSVFSIKEPLIAEIAARSSV